MFRRTHIEVTMRPLFFALVALLLLAAGCAGNRTTNPDVAPSSQAHLTDASSGWSVPPGQKQAGQPDRAATQAAAQPAVQPAVQAPADEAALAAADKAKRDQTAQQARQQAALQPQEQPPQPAPRQEQAVQPIVPAFPARMQDERVPTLQTVHFGFDDWDLTPEARGLLDANAQWMKVNPEVRVQVSGHADERGTPEYNLALGERRAKHVRDYLIEHGVPADNLTVVSYGEEMPLASGHSEAAWSKNRRAEFSRGQARQVSGN
jgi:peptidoglycan-associated lipoprotein